MKVAKIKKVKKKQERQLNTNEYSIKNMIITIFIILLVFLGFYFITKLVVKPNKNNSSSVEEVQLDSSKITLNNLLNRTEEEYYVLAYKESLYKEIYSKMNYLEIYEKYINDYKEKENSLKVYMVNLDDALNKNYESDNLNISNNINEIKLNNEVLFKIKSGSIEEYYVGSSDISDALSTLK